MPGNETDEKNIAAGAFDHVAADHLVDLIIGALYQHGRTARA